MQGEGNVGYFMLGFFLTWTFELDPDKVKLNYQARYLRQT